MSGAGAGFGSFMEGLQGGIGTMQDVRRKKQLDELYDQEITLGSERVSGRDHSRTRAGLDPLKKFSSGDPFLFRLMAKLGRGTNATESPVAGAIPTPGEFETRPQSVAGNLPIDEQDFSGVAAPEYEFADGTAGGLGDWLEDDKAGKAKRPGYDSKADTQSRVEANKAARKAGGAAREAIPTQVVDRSADKTLGQKVAAKAGQATKYEGYGLAAKEGAGMASKAGRFLGRVAAPLAIGGAAAGGIRGALDTETTGDGFWSDVGQRAVGAGKGVVAGLLNPVDAIMGNGGEEAPAPQEAVPTGSSGPSRRYSARNAPAAPAAGASGAGAIPAGPAAAPAEADPMAGFDISKVNAEDIPNFGNKDWEAFREENIKELVANGMSYAEAWDKVDQQTMNTQRRGFLHFASQADALLAAGDKKGASAAVRAAFQYMPSTTDLKVGEYKGHVVAFGVDEETGEQIGTPIVVTPELLQKVQMNFGNPQVWAEYAQDRRKLDQADRELGQNDRRLDLVQEGVGIERENALTKRYEAIGTPGATGTPSLKETDVASARKAIEDWAFGIGSDDENADPALPSALKALAEAEYMRRGGSLNSILLTLEERAKAPNGPATLIAAARRLASGQ
jgi:hypothetical protein